MSSIFDKNLQNEFDSVKDNDEEIIWTGKPKFIPYMISGAGVFLFIIVLITFLILTQLNIISNDNFITYGIMLLMLFAIAVIKGIWDFLYRIFSYSNTLYGYSNKRVMIRTGFIGTNFKIIDYDKISDIEVTVNIIERIYNVGTIKFFSGRTDADENSTSKLYDKWYSIENPYEIFKMVKQISVDIKTDFNYPNAMRPEFNPGYKTQYVRKD
jgi:membrane protein YdbS with pleckstrin-like domain